MTHWEIYVPGPPVPWQRPKSSGPRRFTCPSDAAHRQEVAHAALKAGVLLEREALFTVDLEFTFPYTSGTSVTPRADVDNLTKGVLDALVGIAWEDDRWVTEIRAIKRHSVIATDTAGYTKIQLWSQSFPEPPPRRRRARNS